MNRSTILRRILLAPPSLRSTLLLAASRTYHLPTTLTHPYSTVQSIAQPSFWASLIPKPLRNRRSSKTASKSPRSKEWNPATFFIIIFLLIGSMSIQMIALRNSFAAFDRRAEARIGLLREVIERIQNGEEVDVEGLLGTGDSKREREWEEVLQEIEREDQAWEDSQRKKPKHGKNSENNDVTTVLNPTKIVEEAQKQPEKPSNAPRGFY